MAKFSEGESGGDRSGLAEMRIGPHSGEILTNTGIETGEIVSRFAGMGGAKDMLAGRQQEIQAERDRQLESTRDRHQLRRQ